jgi:hypothetical protein
MDSSTTTQFDQTIYSLRTVWETRISTDKNISTDFIIAHTKLKTILLEHLILGIFSKISDPVKTYIFYRLKPYPKHFQIPKTAIELYLTGFNNTQSQA